MPFTCKQSNMDYWQYCAQMHLFGGLLWGHTVQSLGRNPDLGNAVHCKSNWNRVSRTFQKQVAGFSADEYMPFLECLRRKGKGYHFPLSPHASSVFLLNFSSSPLWASPLWGQIFLPRLLLCRLFRLAGHPLSCEALQHKQPSVSQHLRIRRPQPAAATWIPAPSFSTRGAPRAPSILSL